VDFTSGSELPHVGFHVQNGRAIDRIQTFDDDRHIPYGRHASRPWLDTRLTIEYSDLRVQSTVTKPEMSLQSPEMKQTDDKELEASYLVACAENIAWLLDTNRIENDRLEITGWAISLSGEPDKARFLINGSPFEEVQYPIPSPDLAEFFWNIPAATSGRFVCSTPVEWEKTFRDGFACLEFAPIDVNAEDVRRRAWYLPNLQNALPIPDPARIRRVISVPDTASYLLGGAAVYKRVEHYLEQKFSRTFDDFPRTLDFGCGCGRVSRQFAWSPGTKLYRMDIDADNIR
jgi:hypothetical protein